MSELKVNKISPRSGTDVTLGDSGDAISVASGASLTSPGLTLSDNILFNTASKGIYLGVTSATASNLLDDYEEGTWTPSLVNAGTPTYTTQIGRYTKIGQIVICTFYLNYSSASPGASTRIEGLPFASADNATTRQGFGSSTAATNRAVEGMWTTSSGTTRIQFIRAESASSLEMTGTVVLII
jgi:hypothetical protein